jgi:signal peptidase I
VKWLLFIVLAVSLHAGELGVYGVAPSGSMEPTFNENYYLLAKPLKWSEVKVGDVIIYRPAQPILFRGILYYTIVHRVWKKSSGGSVVICWGDNNELPDSELVTEAMYVATVVKWVTKEEYFKPDFILSKL